MNAQQYLNEMFAKVVNRNAGESEFQQAVKEVFDSLVPVVEKRQELINSGIIERLVEPERQIIFRVPWVDDKGVVQVNRGFRIQFNSAIGPYKGGIRFHPLVNLSIVKFLGFEQIFKNALTGLPLGAGEGGSDFDPKGKSEAEVMRFCQSFMNELFRHIGPDIDVPAGDIGVGSREIGFLYGQYKKLKGASEAGVITGKGIPFGGSLVRKEAAGYGLVYFTDAMLRANKQSYKDKTVVISGSGNVAIYACEKAQLLKANVVAMSDSDGYIYHKEGINIETIKQIKEIERKRISEYIKYHPDAEYHENAKNIWTIKCDIAHPCAIQNELDENSAKTLAATGVMAVAEGSNMPCTLEATQVFLDNKILFAPAKASNAGGAGTSALEMSQNSMRTIWTFEEVDNKLRNMMINIYNNASAAAKEYGFENNLVIGSNIAGFIRVADAMLAQGVV